MNQTEDPPAPPINFMRPFALGATAYTFGINLLQLITRGEFQSPDHWGDVYAAVLLAYSGAPEIKRLMSEDPAADPDHWEERVRKGGPIITLWFLLLAAAGFWRMHDHTVPMPPELKSITLKVLAIFFGTYAFRQYRRRVQVHRAARRADAEGTGTPGDAGFTAPPETEDRQRICAFLKENGPATPKAIAEALGLSRRTVGRLLDALKEEGRLTRQARGPYDRAAVYGPAATSNKN